MFPEAFVKKPKIKLIGEPGRFIAQEALTTVARIVLARQQKDFRHYIVDTGVFQAFGCLVFDKEFFRAQPMLSTREILKREKKNSFIWGQSCDEVSDWMMREDPFPKMNTGEWIMYRGVGAYNSALKSRFESFSGHKTFYI